MVLSSYIILCCGIAAGDNRITGMETGTALARAMMRVMKNPHYHVDVINMSYGEHAHWSDSGWVCVCVCVCQALCCVVSCAFVTY